MSAESRSITVSKTVSDAVADEAHAPFVFFDRVPTAGVYNDVVAVTLAAARNLPHEGQLHDRPVAVAYLRMSLAGAVDLRNALNKSIAMAAPKRRAGSN